jgi:hypothetical protein
MGVRIVVRAQTRKGSLSIINIADNVKIPGDTNCSIVAELERATALVHEPEFASWRNWWHLIDGKNSADNNSLLDIALLRDKDDLVARTRRARDSQAVPYPLR